MVVDMPSFFSEGTAITEFGAIRIVSSPRTRSTRPLRPVRIVSPGFRTSSCFNDACSAPVADIQTSPDDLLTDQTPSSPASALELAPRSTEATVTMRRNQTAPAMLHLGPLSSGPQA